MSDSYLDRLRREALDQSTDYQRPPEPQTESTTEAAASNDQQQAQTYDPMAFDAEDPLGLETDNEQSQKRPEKPEGSLLTDAAYEAEVKPSERPEGPLTKAGELLETLLHPTNIQNNAYAVINKLTPNWAPWKEITQAADDFVLSKEELEEVALPEIAEQMEDPTALKITTGLSSAIPAGIASPYTLITRLAGQATPWSNKPAMIEDEPWAEAAFNIMEVVLPSAIYFGAPLSWKGVAGLSVTESALETAATVENNDDLIAGRWTAQQFASLGNQLFGYDEDELTRELIEGESFNSKLFTNTLGFVQNLGLNIPGNSLAKWMSGGKAIKPTENLTTAAEALGKSTDEVAAAVDDVVPLQVKAYEEIDDAVTADTVVPVSKATEGKSISEDALVTEIARKPTISESFYTAADRSYFTNLDALSQKEGVKRVIDEATSTLERLPYAPKVYEDGVKRALNFFNQNRRLLGVNREAVVPRADVPIDEQDLTSFLTKFEQEFVEPESKTAEIVATFTGAINDPEVFMRAYGRVNEEGFVAALLVGDELATRLQKVATRAVRADAKGVDFTRLVDIFSENVDYLNTFMIPLRRAKRAWNVGGIFQQPKEIERLAGLDVMDPINKKTRRELTKQSKRSVTDGENLIRIRKDADDEGLSFPKLWELAKGGDEDALKTTKDYLKYVAFGDSNKVLEEVDDLSRGLSEDLFKGTTDARNTLYYAAMLSRISTQATAVGNTIINLGMEPIGNAAAGKASYALGQFFGGFAAIQDSFEVYKRVFTTMQPVNSGSRYVETSKNLIERQSQLDRTYRAAQAKMQNEDAPMSQQLAAWGSYTAQKLANNVLVNLPSRLLTAGDEALQTISATQVAAGMALQKTVRNKDWLSLNKNLTEEYNAMFRALKEGDPVRKIVDSNEYGALEVSRYTTMQRNIPTEGNVVDNFFLKAKEAADENFIYRFFVPFTRLAWNSFEATGRMIAGQFTIGVPGTQWQIGGSTLMNMIPRYKKIMNGEYGEAVKTQLQGQYALGQYLTYSAVGFSSLGMMTGYNSGELPETSFIIPAPNTKKGYIAISYAKLEPYASILAYTSDLVNSFRIGAISRGEYSTAVAETITSISAATLDKQFLDGLQTMTEVLSLKNMTEDKAVAISNFVTGFSPALLRAAGNIISPYRKNVVDEGNPLGTYGAKLNQRVIGGIGLPEAFDELTGEKVPSVATAKDGNEWFNAAAGSLFQEFLPFKVKNAPKDDKVKMFLDKIGFEYNAESSFRDFKGTKLSLQEQSKLQYDMHHVAGLRYELEAYINRKNGGTSLLESYNEARRDNFADSKGRNTRAEGILEKLRRDVRGIYRTAKEEAVRNGQLGQDPSFIQKVQLDNELSVNPEPSKAQGLVAWAYGAMSTPEVNRLS